MSLRKAHAENRGSLLSLKDVRSSAGTALLDDARSRSLAFAAPPMTLLIAERAFEVFPHIIHCFYRFSVFDTLRRLSVSFEFTFHQLCNPHRTYRHFRLCTPLLRHLTARPLLLTLPEGVAGIGRRPTRPPARSARAVSHDFDGLLRTMLAGLLRPASGHKVDGVSDLRSTPRR